MPLKAWFRDKPCFYCGRTSESRDHVEPRAKTPKGTHRRPWIDLVPACNPCNTAKGDMSVEAFRVFLRNAVKTRLKWSEHPTATIIASNNFRFYGEKNASLYETLKLVNGVI